MLVEHVPEACILGRPFEVRRLDHGHGRPARFGDRGKFRQKRPDRTDVLDDMAAHDDVEVGRDVARLDIAIEEPHPSAESRSRPSIRAVVPDASHPRLLADEGQEIALPTSHL